jgi:NTE family protein
MTFWKKLFGEKKVGLVLSGGSSRGIAHIGVLKILKENDVNIDYIAGSSMGALIGAAYSAGMSIEDIEKKVLKFNQKELSNLSDWSFRTGLIKGEKIEKFIKDFIKVKDFSELKIPLVVNATDLSTGKEVIFNKGNLIHAIRASMNFPGYFAPIKIENRYLVDGGLVNPVPMSLLQDYGMDVTIISNTIGRMTKIKENPNLIDVVKQSIDIMQSELGYSKIRSCEIKKIIVIEPEVGDFDLFDFNHHAEIIKLGEYAAKARMDEIEKEVK